MFSFFDRFGVISRISIKPPLAKTNRSGVAIVTMVKNESEYILEWLNFHLTSGVQHFYIYDNGSTDNTVELLRDAIGDEVLTIFPWQQEIGPAFPRSAVIHNQVLAYAHAASNFGGAYRWMAFIDVDEFLIPRHHASINDALDELSSFSNISLPWHMFGTSGHAKKPEGGVLKNYTNRYRLLDETDAGMMNFKCIVDPCSLTCIRVHSMQTGGEWLTVNDEGESRLCSKRNQAGFYSSKLIQLNHYYTRSEEEFLRKANKGHVLNSRSVRYKEKLLKKITKIDSDTVEDLTAIEYLRGQSGA